MSEKINFPKLSNCKSDDSTITWLECKGLKNTSLFANEPAERRRSAGEAAENSAARRMVYAKKFSIGIEKCKCKV